MCPTAALFPIVFLFWNSSSITHVGPTLTSNEGEASRVVATWTEMNLFVADEIQGPTSNVTTFLRCTSVGLFAGPNGIKSCAVLNLLLFWSI
jgi:hypothetical protein